MCVVEATVFLHSLNFIHKDINPSNMLFDHAMFRVKLGDFGLAEILDDNGYSQINHSDSGTSGFIAPEVMLLYY
jgi:serine/threonine protein kinase